ncbi:Transmembrane protein [Trema orientale]|uniref:Transmembrane protein n=1 Tax=Trema orientale TaxID=63057 RepID=A0A2P5E037_TREOI|nr:Transmembrane protein [Trema orientale]
MGVNDIDPRPSSGVEDVAQIQIGVAEQDKMEDTNRTLELVKSDQRHRPLLYLLEDSKEARHQYLCNGLPLYKAALNNDWRTAQRIIKQDSRIVRAAITRAEETALHIAAGAKHIKFVKELVNLMDKNDLALQDGKGNTAFCFAALTGSVEIAKIMMHKNKHLPLVRGGQGMTPLYMATLFGQTEMSWFLYPITKVIILDHQGEWMGIFFTCIHSDLYGLALKMFQDDSSLAIARDVNNDTALHILARKSLAFLHQSPRPRKNYTATSSLMSSYNMSSKMESQALQLARVLWKEILVRLPNLEVKQLINRPSRLLFEAAELGNFQFLVELIRIYPELVWDVDEKNRTIFHVAVLNRHTNIFNLIYEIGSIKDVILTFEDDDKNNILHLAATLPPPHKLNPELGGTLQLQQELSWFKEVQSIMLPSYAVMKNSNGLTPKDVFTTTHAPLLKDGERWMKSTAKSCLMVSILIVVGILVTASRAHYDNERTTFNWEAMALFSSLISTLTFLSILTSGYVEIEFLGSIHVKLIIGLATLFISMTTMLLAFNGGMFLILSYPHRILKGIPTLTLVIGSIPIALFVFLEYRFLSKLLYLSLSSSFIFQARKSIKLYK